MKKSNFYLRLKKKYNAFKHALFTTDEKTTAKYYSFYHAFKLSTRFTISLTGFLCKKKLLKLFF